MRAVLTVLAGLVLAGALAWGVRSDWQVPLVTVRVENAGPTAITAVRLSHGDTRREYGALAAGESTTLRYMATGTSRYSLTVTLAGGGTLRTRSGPVQPGWTVTEVVSGRAIHSTYSATARVWRRPVWLGGGQP